MRIEHQIVIDMDQTTVEALDAGKYSLYAFKAVTAAQGGATVVWFATEVYSETTYITAGLPSGCR